MKCYIETYGCTANKSDESKIRAVLLQHHHELVDDLAQADIIIIITCTVIGTTEQRMLSRLRVFKKTQKPVIVTGCMPAVQPKLITDILPSARLLPPSEIGSIIDTISGRQPATTQKQKQGLPVYYTSLYAPITIVEGCMQSCSYCITRFARGPLISYSVKEIISHVHQALQQGCKEIQLTAQDTAAYGDDINISLDQLIAALQTQTTLHSIAPTFRIRIGMMNPHTAFKKLDDIIACYRFPNVYKFIHLPLQSGDNTILQKMNRNYTVEEFYELLTKIRIKIPTMSLSTDVIVGFPTETDDQFYHTCSFLEKIQPDVINITRFSPRPQTSAKNMRGRIPTKIVKERSQRISELCTRIQRTKNKKYHGKTCSVLITEYGKNKTFFGRTENYKPVILSEQVNLGDIHPVQIIDSSDINLYGKLI